MITPAYNLTATERVLPSLALDFTTGSLDPRVTFTRTENTATVTNSSGAITAINADLPRFDYNPVTLAPRGLLIEEARTNLLTYSEQFDNAVWVKSSLTVVGNSVVSPSGLADGDAIYETTDNAEHVLRAGSFSITAGVPITASIYVKNAGADTVAFRFGSSFMGSFQTATFNLATEAVTLSGGLATASMTAVGNGWYRIRISATPTTSTTSTEVFRFSLRRLGQSYAGDPSKGVFIWGAQLEAGAFETSYIPTTATSLTRNADVATMTGTNFSSWYNDSIGTFVTVLASMQVKGTTDCVIIELFNSGAPNNRRSSVINAAFGNLVFRSVNNAGTITDVNVNSAATANPSKIAGSYNASTTTIAESVNASTVASRNTASTPTGINTLNIGRGRNNNAYLNQCISKLLFYPQQLTNAEIQAFSK